MAASDRPIAWTALQPGTSVMASDGAEIGKVSTIVADENKDIFSGVAFRHGIFGSEHFIPADLVDRITDEQVFVNLTSQEAGELERYDS